MNDSSFRDLRTSAGVDPGDVTITFPCAYPIKVVGDAAQDFAALVAQIVLRHDPEFDATGMQVIDSRNGRFQSVRLTLTATGEDQLKALFEELKATGRVHMVV